MILPLNDRFRAAVNSHVAEEWAGPVIVSRGVAHDTSAADGFLSVTGDELTGYALYAVRGGECEILALQSLRENCGVGSALIRAILDKARACGCGRVWLITTNDNLHAIRFYQRFCFELTAVHINALEQSRRLKPSIPLTGSDGIPLKHEFEFSYAL